MREIIFRAYDNELNIFVPNFDLVFRQYGDTNIELFQQGKVTIDQFTGLKDKNGVEIFENDICRFNTKNNQPNHEHIVYVVFEEKKGMWIIKYLDGEKFHYNPYLYLWIDRDLINFGFEVIGNIHNKIGQ